MEKTITILLDTFEEQLFNRVEEFGINHYDYDFWKDAIDYLSSIGWESLPIDKRDPMYIIDNISINGEIKTANEIINEYNYGLKTEKEVEEKAEEKGWVKCGDYWILNWGI